MHDYRPLGKFISQLPADPNIILKTTRSEEEF